MECYVPGRVLILPGPESKPSEIFEESELPIEYEFSIVDVLRELELWRDFDHKESMSYPIVARVPEGEEVEIAKLLIGKWSVASACPDYMVRPSANFIVDHSAISSAIFHINGQPVAPSCGANCTVAILDSGIDTAYLSNPALVHSLQYNVVDPARPGVSHSDSSGHGTLIARIISEIAPAAQILSIKTLNPSGTVSGVLCGLYIARTFGSCDVVNMSLSVSCVPDPCKVCRTPGPEATNAEQLKTLFENVLQSMPSTIMVAAAGNGYRHVAMPAAFSGIIAVGEFDYSQAQPSPNSARYARVPTDRYVLAPGGVPSALATFPGLGGGRLANGTSFSTAFATGVVARYVCGLKGGPCGGLRTKPPAMGLFDYIRDELGHLADKGFASYDANTWGMGVLRYQ